MIQKFKLFKCERLQSLRFLLFSIFIKCSMTQLLIFKLFESVWRYYHGQKKAAQRTISNFPIVGIAASAGGLEAYESFFERMPSKSGMAFILVSHLDPTHISILPEILTKKTKMKAHQIEDGQKIEPNHVYVIPPNKDLSILNGSLILM